MVVLTQLQFTNLIQIVTYNFFLIYMIILILNFLIYISFQATNQVKYKTEHGLIILVFRPKVIRNGWVTIVVMVSQPRRRKFYPQRGLELGLCMNLSHLTTALTPLSNMKHNIIYSLRYYIA